MVEQCCSFNVTSIHTATLAASSCPLGIFSSRLFYASKVCQLPTEPTLPKLPLNLMADNDKIPREEVGSSSDELMIQHDPDELPVSSGVNRQYMLAFSLHLEAGLRA